jgi:hypothetical protein
MGISWFESLDKLPILNNKRWEIQKTGRSRTQTISYLASYRPEDAGSLNTLIKLQWGQSHWCPMCSLHGSAEVVGQMLVEFYWEKQTCCSMVPAIRLLVISWSCSGVGGIPCISSFLQNMQCNTAEPRSGPFDPVKFEEGGGGGESIMSCLEGPW